MVHSIGPIWDGNEVWLIVAGAATFAAFPEWYATLFSGFYLALFLILIGLIIRNVAFELWGKSETPAWRTGWSWAIVVGSLLPALLWGVAWANIVHGVPIDAAHEFTGTLFTLLKPYALLGGLATLSLFLFHGALFLSLRTTGAVEERARNVASRVAPAAAVIGIGFLVWTLINQGDRGGVDAVSAVLAAATAVALVAAVALARSSPGRAFAVTSGAIILLFCALFVDLYPNAMVSTTEPAFDITLNEAASGNNTLIVMTVVAGLLLPFVLLYQGWSYWVFRHRISAEGLEGIKNPLDLLDRRADDKAAGSGGATGTDSPT